MDNLEIAYNTEKT